VRKCFLFFLFGALAIHCIGQAEENQQPRVTIHYVGNDYLLKIVKNYFRSDPYRNEFGLFLKHLMNDPILVNKSTRLRTDTSLFYFQGVYKNYSPYGFLADRTEIRLTEQEIIIDDSLSLKDTLVVYQLLGFNNGKAGLESVKNEFSKFNRHYGKHFIIEPGTITQGTEIVGATEDYFIAGVAVSPLTVAWAKLDEFENAFIITLRLKIK
jgi:hypothetical protein